MRKIEIVIRITENDNIQHEKNVAELLDAENRKENPRYIKTISNLGCQFMPLDEL